MSRPRHAARFLGLRLTRGRAEQPDGRHTAEYVASTDTRTGMFPLGGARRVTPHTNTHVDDDRETNNDPGRIFR